MGANAKTLTEEELLPEYNRRLKDGKSRIPDIIKILIKKSGLSKIEVTKIINSATSDRKSRSEIEKLVLEHLGVASISREIGRWIRDTANGDSSFALQLADTLLETGILVIEGKKGTSPLALNAPALSDLPQGAFGDHTEGSSPFSPLKEVADAFTSQVIDGLKKTPPIVEAYKSWPEFGEWTDNNITSTSGLNLRKVRRWGDPVMIDFHFDVDQVGSTNFQAVGLYNEATGFGGVTNYLYIEREDIENLWEMQFDEVVNGTLFTRDLKMNWLAASDRGKIYMLDSEKDSWQKSPRIRWGSIALGGNLVQVEREEDFHPDVKLPSGKTVRTMARLAGFRKTDWKRPLDELLAEGLVHRCFGAGKGNDFGDSPHGIVYSPFFSPLDWDFAGQDKPSHFYLPLEYFETKGK